MRFMITVSFTLYPTVSWQTSAHTAVFCLEGYLWIAPFDKMLVKKEGCINGPWSRASLN